MLKSQVDGTASKPITIRGAGVTGNIENVVLHGAGDSTRVFEIKHDYYIIEVRGLFRAPSSGWIGRKGVPLIPTIDVEGDLRSYHSLHTPTHLNSNTFSARDVEGIV